MTKQEKVEAVKDAAREAADLLAEAYATLRTAERDTGYEFNFQIKQEIDGDHPQSAICELQDISSGDADDDVESQIADDEEDDNAK